MTPHQRSFIDLALSRSALRFGRYTLKSGRESPYFFNAGLFNDGEALAVLGRCYAAALAASGVDYDMLFGPAYKGIPLVATTAVALSEHHGRSVPWAFNRKEAKDHGEGGTLVGAPVKGRVVIIDDVISAGTSVRESVELIRAAGAEPAAVLIALDRMERSGNAIDIGEHSAVQSVEHEFGIPVIAIANLSNLMDYLDASKDPALQQYLPAVTAYRKQYGIKAG